MAKKYDAGVKDYRETYWMPDYTPKETDILACFKITPQPGVPREEAAAAVAAERPWPAADDRWSKVSARDFEAVVAELDAVRREVAVVSYPDFNRFAHGFSHIFGGGYAAGYYSYKWAEVLSADAFSLFEEKGVFNVEAGRAFRENILEKGGSADAMDLFVAFRGRKPEVEPLLRHSGIAA